VKKALLGLAVALRAPFLGLLVSVLGCTVLLVAAGERPTVLLEAFQSTLFTGFGLGYTLFYTTPLIFTGLAVAICYHCGLFNIGAEGQLYIGAIAIVVVASLLPGLPAPLAVPVGILAAALAGGAWGGLAGFLKARRGSHEVIVTILLNFIAFSLVNYLILYPYKQSETQNVETVSLGAGYHLPVLGDYFAAFKTTPLNATLFLAILTAVFFHFFLFRTTKGYELRAVGLSPIASRFSGIRVGRNTILALFLGGAVAGLVGVNEAMGYQHKIIEGFSPGYGFTGIAVALLARNNPLGILLSAFLFGTLHNASRELEFLSEKVTKELSLVLEGTLIAFIASDYLIESLLRRSKNVISKRRKK
jgi:simple sugar transport system permease protein